MGDVPRSAELEDDAWSETPRRPTNRIASHPIGHFPIEFLTAFASRDLDLSEMDPQLLKDFKKSIGILDDEEDMQNTLRYMQETARILLEEALSFEDLT